VGVAVSGGPDSMALLVCLCKLAPIHGFSVAGVHFEHGIRGQESQDDADFVAGFCEGKGIPFYLGAAYVPALAGKWKLSKQTAAKRAREAYFDSLVKGGDVDCIATAHHKNDAAESVLMHILRGSGTAGLAGIRRKKGAVIRPFLCLGRDDIDDYIAEEGIPFVRDSSNDSLDYTRNYIRGAVMPLLEEHVNADAAGALLRLGEIAEQDEDYLIQKAGAAFEECACFSGGRVEIGLERFGKLHRAIRSRIVRLACAALSVTQDIGYAHIGAVLKLADEARTGTQADLPHGLCARVEYSRLVIGRKRLLPEEFEIPLRRTGRTMLPDGAQIVCRMAEEYTPHAGGGVREYFDADRLPHGLRVRTRIAGDRIHPLGAPGGKKLKDYFIDKKVARPLRDAAVLVADGQEVVWAVGYVMGEAYRVREDTEHILEMTYIAGTEEEDGALL